jgi:hypothetical protein
LCGTITSSTRSYMCVIEEAVGRLLTFGSHIANYLLIPRAECSRMRKGPWRLILIARLFGKSIAISRSWRRRLHLYTHFSLVGRGAWLNDRPFRLQPNDLPSRLFAPEGVNSQQGRFRLSMSALLFSRIGLNNKACPEARLSVTHGRKVTMSSGKSEVEALA